jgi:hypothetical protein
MCTLESTFMGLKQLQAHAGGGVLTCRWWPSKQEIINVSVSEQKADIGRVPDKLAAL